MAALPPPVDTLLPTPASVLSTDFRRTDCCYYCTTKGYLASLGTGVEPTVKGNPGIVNTHEACTNCGQFQSFGACNREHEKLGWGLHMVMCTPRPVTNPADDVSPAADAANVLAVPLKNLFQFATPEGTSARGRALTASMDALPEDNYTNYDMGRSGDSAMRDAITQRVMHRRGNLPNAPQDRVQWNAAFEPMSDANLAAAARKAGLIPHIRRSQQARSQVITAKTRDNVHATALKAIIYAKYISFKEEKDGMAAICSIMSTLGLFVGLAK